MPLVPISAIDDPRIAVFRDLPRSNLTRPSGLFIAEGALLVERLLASRFPVESFLLDERFVESHGPLLPNEAPIYVTPRALVNELLGFKFHRGLLACGRRQPMVALEAALPTQQTAITVVVAENIHDPENMGGLIRNSAAFGADVVLMNSRCADPFSRRVLRTSMGSVFNIPLVESNDLVRDVQRLKQEWQFQTVAAVVGPNALSLPTVPPPSRLALVMGNEGHGLTEDLVAACEQRVTIPMSRGTDSLNVAVATGVFLYHFLRDNPP